MEEIQSAIERVKGGDKDAYGLIVKRYMRRAYFTALGWVGEPEDARDVSQQAFINAYRYIKSFEDGRPFYPWFYRILLNECKKFLARRKRSPEVPLEWARSASADEVDLARRAQIKAAVSRAVSGLPDPQREVITLRYFQELSYQEIAEAVGCPLGTVMSRLYYAKRRLRKELERIL